MSIFIDHTTNNQYWYKQTNIQAPIYRSYQSSQSNMPRSNFQFNCLSVSHIFNCSNCRLGLCICLFGPTQKKMPGSFLFFDTLGSTMGYFIALRRRATVILTSRDYAICASRVIDSFHRQLLIVVSSYRYYYLEQLYMINFNLFVEIFVFSLICRIWKIQEAHHAYSLWTVTIGKDTRK